MFLLIRRPSCYSCIRVNTLKSTPNAVIDKLLAILKEKGGVNFSENANLCNNDASCDLTTAIVEEDTCSKDNNNYRSFHGCDKAASEQVDVTNVLRENLYSSAISKCQFPGLDYVLFVRGSGPHKIDYGYADGVPPKEVIVSRKCAEAVLRGAQVSVFSTYFVMRCFLDSV